MKMNRKWMENIINMVMRVCLQKEGSRIERQDIDRWRERNRQKWIRMMIKCQYRRISEVDQQNINRRREMKYRINRSRLVRMDQKQKDQKQNRNQRVKINISYRIRLNSRMQK